jgi:hypothetical protein
MENPSNPISLSVKRGKDSWSSMTGCRVVFIQQTYPLSIPLKGNVLRKITRFAYFATLP